MKEKICRLRKKYYKLPRFRFVWWRKFSENYQKNIETKSADTENIYHFFSVQIYLLITLDGLLLSMIVIYPFPHFQQLMVKSSLKVFNKNLKLKLILRPQPFCSSLP